MSLRIQQHARLGIVLLALEGCVPELKDGTILCDNDAQCYASARCQQSPDRSHKYCYMHAPNEVDATVGESNLSDASLGDASAAPECTPLAAGKSEELEDTVEDLGDIELPQGWDMRAPGPAAWLPNRERIWLFSKAANGGALPNGAPSNYPTAAWIRSAPQSALKITPPPQQEPPPFVSLRAEEAAETVLWPSTIARNVWDDDTKRPENPGVAFLRRIVGGSIRDVMLARIAPDSTMAERLPDPLFTGSDRPFSTGLYSGSDNTYVYACEEDRTVAELADERYRCFIAKTPNESIEERSKYQVYQLEAGRDLWGGDLSAGTPVLFGASELTVLFDQYLNDKRVAIHVHPRSGKLIVQTADRPWGPWTKRGEVELPRSPGAERPSSAFVTIDSECGRRFQIAYATPTRRDDLSNVVEARTHIAAIRWR